MRTHFDELKLLVELTHPKIVILSETHLTPDRDFDEFEIPKYKHTACLSRTSHSGGVLMYIDDRLEFVTVSNTTAGDNWFLAIEVKNTPLAGIYGGVYHSPSSSDVRFVESFEEWLNEVFVDGKTNIFVGDFNIRWNEPGCARELKNVTEALGMKQHVSKPTRTGPTSSTTIDLVFTNIEDCEACIMEDMKVSDHETIGITVTGLAPISLQEENKLSLSWKRYSRERLQAVLRDDRTLSAECTSVNEAAEKFSTALVSAVEQLTEMRRQEARNSNSWYGAHLRMMRAERDVAYRVATESRDETDWQWYKWLRNRYVQEIRLAKNQSVRRRVEECQGDSKRLWRCLKSLMKPGGEPKTSIIFDQERSDDETAKMLNTFFVKSVQDINAKIPPALADMATDEEVIEDGFVEFAPITAAKLRGIVSNLKNCAGVDRVTKRVMTDAFDVVENQLLRIVNDSLQCGLFPAAWKKTMVIPIPKVARSTRPEDHRPINILPLYEKVLETVVKEQLVAYVDRTRMLIEEQSGFRKHHSCETALNLLLLKWKQYIERGKIVLSVFVDLKRAFETIDRAKLIGALHRMGIRGTVLKWFSSYLENRIQVTRYNSAVSPAAAVDLGVPQGSVLGPLLFIIYMNDVKRALRAAEVNLFADDTVLFVTGDSFDECFDVMNEELKNYSEWLKWKKLKLNVSKTKYMVVTTRQRNSCNGIVQIDGEVVERVEAMKYLGVMLDEKLNFSEHIDYTIRKAARKFGVLCRVSRYLTDEAKIVVYKTIIAPHFDYCASILFLATKQQMKRMQILQNKVMRLILHCDRLTPRLFMLECLQWMSVRQRIEYNTLVFVFRVTKGMAPQYLTNTVVYGRDVHQHNTRQAADLRLPSYRKTCTQNSLFHKGYNLFNQLPENAKRTSNLREFKSLCKSFVAQRALA